MSFDSAITRSFSPLLSWPGIPGAGDSASEVLSALSSLGGPSADPDDGICPDKWRVPVPVPQPGPGPDPYSVSLVSRFDAGMSGYETMSERKVGKDRPLGTSEAGAGFTGALTQLTPERSPQLGAQVTPTRIQQA